MRKRNARLERESAIVAGMIAIYCQRRHSHNKLCPECSALLDYARQRLDKCPFQEDKPTCAGCPVHCYKLEMREKIRIVMRYSGPRMIYRHPILAISHLIDARRKKPISKTHLNRKS